MPRITPITYISRHHQLKQLWSEYPRWFSYLTPNDQMALHTYYLLTLDKTDEELLTHHSNVKIGDSTLPQRAGRAYARLERGDRSKVRSTQTSSGRSISVRTLMRPTPDLHLLSKAAIYTAMHEVEKELQQNPYV
jgi:hypothetical protein